MKSDTVIGIKKVKSLDMTSFVLVCLIAIFTFFVTSCGKEKEVTEKKVIRPVKILTLVSSSADSKLIFTGKVRASQRVDLSFQVPGTLVKLPVVEGKEMKTGDLLAQIDPKDFQTHLRKAQGQLAKTKAALERAQGEYERILRIQKEDPGATSQTMVDRRREAVDKSKAEIKSFQAAVDDAKNQLSYTYLKAPFSGVIARRYVDNFKEVRAKERIVSLQDISQLEIVIDVPENVMATVKRGSAKAYAEFSVAPERQFELTPKEIAREADPKTQTYRVVGAMTAPEGVTILPGMTANVSVYMSGTGGSSEGYIIPAIAVFADESGNSNVWVVDRDTMAVHKRKVSTGNLTGTESIRILKGLEAGEKIAITGVAQLREGMEVRDLSELEGYKR